MFNSTTNLIYFPQFLSSYSHNLPPPPPPPPAPLPPYIGHHHQDPVLSQFLQSNMQELDVSMPNFLHLVEKKAVRKDRRSKICTAKGIRDRRVRLSIDIARKFFDLQDLLGFDKPSKTLDWLLTKSKDSIKDLMDKSVSITLDREMASRINSLDAEKGKFIQDLSSKKIKKVSFHLSAKELRAKARARARERTRKKLSGDINPNILNQLWYLNSIGTTNQEPTREFITRHNTFIIFSPNWDINGRFGFYAIANLNLTKEVQICGIPSEIHKN